MYSSRAMRPTTPITLMGPISPPSPDQVEYSAITCLLPETGISRASYRKLFRLFLVNNREALALRLDGGQGGRRAAVESHEQRPISLRCGREADLTHARVGQRLRDPQQFLGGFRSP